MMKYINKSVTHLFDSADDAKTEIWEAINKADKKALRIVYQKIINVTEKEGYWKCCAEGQISHVLSARLSSRPMGWSTLGCDQMSKFRAFKMNDGKVIDLLRYQKEKQKKEEGRKYESLIKELRDKKSNWAIANGMKGEIPGIESRELNWMKSLVNIAISIA